MDDSRIVELYWQRSEQAVTETHRKYGRFCYSIAYRILTNNEDAEETVNDTYARVWNSLPPQRPKVLAAFLGKITRNLSISRWRSRSADKRGGGEMVLALEELGECISDGSSLEDTYIRREVVSVLRRFLNTLPETERNVFMRRYFLLDPIGEIARDFGFTESKVKSMLHRTRIKLRTDFEKEELL